MADYKSTLNLPRTAFPMKAGLPAREPQMLAHWERIGLYQQIRQARSGAERFILHDGPPYANGDIHIGHALNKVLKDLIVRYKTMRGYDAPYVPGWDCHGMPIEHQLFRELKLTKHQIAQGAFREQARAYAQRYVEIQREQFKRLGVSGDWDRPYLTMAKDYELAILRVFRELLEAGYVYRGRKPVYWCAACETALAEAEVEYEKKQSPSLYVSFPVKGAPLRQSLEGVEALVWTTTPWTLPANVALAIHPEGEYVVGEVKWVGRRHRFLLGRRRAESDEFRVHLTNWDTVATTVFKGSELEGVIFQHPFLDREVKGVLDGGVALDEGTGVVHIAPGHGQEDYLIGQRYQLPLLSPVDAQGQFTEEVGRPELIGLSVVSKEMKEGTMRVEANQRVLELLDAAGHHHVPDPRTIQIEHDYPHCWRCKHPVIFRATPQWFLSIEHQGLRKRLLEQARGVAWIPPAGLNRISGMLESRPDWCVSRQRYWGTPIPILHCVACDEPLTDAKLMRQIEESLNARGVEAWFSASPAELAPGAACPRCQGSNLRKETDILDVWFDSGVSHEAVLKARPELRWPASLYLEGSDQHRGWFQVSLIPSVALHGKPPYEGVLTHGFVMDGQGRKMSKSLGNVVAPQDVMERYGADILRLWVASCDYREDVRISEEILGQVAESYRKIRNTLRYLLANLHDFDPRRDAAPAGECPELDRWALDRTGALTEAVTQAYDACQFHEAVRALYQYCVLDLSAFYLDALKDRLYTEAQNSAKRRWAQSVIYAILLGLVRMLAPILAVTAEEVWQALQGAGWAGEASVHLAAWPTGPQRRFDQEGRRRWETFLSMRTLVMKALEEQRSRGVIGSPLEAQVTLVVGDRELQHLCEAHRETLTEAFVVSGVDVQADGTSPGGPSAGVPGLAAVRVERAAGRKCQRCWKHLDSVGKQAAHPDLCERCAGVVLRCAPRDASGS